MALSEILSTQTATQATKPEIRHDTAPQDLDESYLKSFDGAVQAGHVELLAEGRYMCNVCEKEYANKSSIKSHLTTNKHSTKLSEILSTQTATQATKPEIRHDTAPQDLDESYLKSFDGAVQAGHVELLAEGRYMCNVCEKEYANKSSIKSHLTTNKHSTKLSEILSTQTATQATKPEIRHDTAPQDLDESYLKSFDGAVQAGHVELLAEGRYMCNVCEKEYANKSSIKSHLTTNKHSTKLSEILSTQTATQATKPEIRHDTAPQDLDESYLKSFDGAVQAGHVELLAEGRYMRNVCEKEYANKSSIKRHLTTNKHSTKLPEVLSTQTATQATKPETRHDSAPQDLDESYHKIFDGAVQAGHVELLAEGRYMCNVCEKEYANKSSIKSHLTTNKHSTKLSEILSTQTATQATKPEIRHDSAPQVTDAEVMARLRIKRQEKKNELEYHTNTQLPPGRVEIFNYIFFHYNTRQRLEDRKGAKMDSTNLKITFNRLGYQVFVHENLTANDTFMELENIRKSCKQKPPQAIFFFFLSHGNQGNEFMSADGVPLNIDKIKDEFTNDLCPELAKKPKIFMTNYCRGDNEECLETDGHVRIPQDLVTIYASRDGIAAYRLPNEGTSFVLSLCKVLEKLRERTELHDLYLLLMDEMKRNKATTPIWEEIGFKKFYLEIPERK
ncbi:zinc finger protein 646-like isoform X14 [Portunus trituberculatus]|uniref:zinc finger protein 646-like isoform X14 n=1 Tax=Portunus trituberculatus TaxID=210409 RepID=UPI001E1D121A|nr:zinc finger protein 646-like isoform X14 [Portunus trituberculatus]